MNIFADNRLIEKNISVELKVCNYEASVHVIAEFNGS